MKAILFFISFFSVLTFTACTGSDSLQTEDLSTLESVKMIYGAEMAPLSLQNQNDIPSVTLNEVQCVLETLQKNSNINSRCIVEESTDEYFGGSNETVKKVIMGSNYQVFTAGGTMIEDFILRVELNFSIEKGQVYYFGTDYTYNSELFNWRANGLSLAPVKNATGYTYAFESESALYFRVKDEGNSVIKVPVIFKGNYDFKSERGTYSFQLLKCNR